MSKVTVVCECEIGGESPIFKDAKELALWLVQLSPSEAVTVHIGPASDLAEAEDGGR